MKIVLASHNKNKIKELKELLEDTNIKDIDLLTLDDIGYDKEIIEDGSSFEENAMIKASAIASDKIIAVADDSGLCVEALNGAPGIYSARYSGEDANDEKNIALLLKNLNGVDNRNAYFISNVACIMPNGENFVCEGRFYGKILNAPKGENGFGYDPIFFIPELGKTAAELSPNEKNAISHRGKAMRAFAIELKKRLNG